MNGKKNWSLRNSTVGLRFFWVQDHHVLSFCLFFFFLAVVVLKQAVNEELMVGICSLLQAEVDEALSEVVYIY